MWTFGEKIGNGWKKILWQSGKIAFIFSISIEMLQLLLRLGTFQVSDIVYNTLGGMLGGLCYIEIKKVRSISDKIVICQTCRTRAVTVSCINIIMTFMC